MALAPVLPLRQRMSVLPSPSKSPKPAMYQFGSVTVTSCCRVLLLPDFHTTLANVIEWRHTRSARPSPSRSPDPAMFQLESKVGIDNRAAELAASHTVLA